MKTSRYFYFKVFCLLVLFNSLSMCSTEKEEKTPADELTEAMEELKKELKDVEKDLKQAGKDAEGGISEAMTSVTEAMQELQKDGKVVEPVNFRVLKSGIPKTFLGMERTKNEGETSGAMGFKVSTAKAIFEDGDKKVEIEIIDVGGLGMAAMGMAAWSMAEIDKESDEGFERTITYDGHKAFEKCRNDRCEFSTWINERVIFNIKSRNVGIDDIKKGIKRDVDLDDLMDNVADEG